MAAMLRCLTSGRVFRAMKLAGMGAVQCLRLNNRGLYRWYIDCCRTPIGNTAGPRVPLIGVIHCFMKRTAVPETWCLVRPFAESTNGSPLSHSRRRRPRRRPTRA